MRRSVEGLLRPNYRTMLSRTIPRSGARMIATALRTVALTALAISQSVAQTTTNPLLPIDSVKAMVAVNVAEFASIPDLNGQAARMMLLVDEPGTKRLFVNDMRGPIYSVSYDGRTVALYVDVNDSTWG